MMQPTAPPAQEKVNLNPVYAVLALVTLLAIIVTVLAAANNGAISGLRTEPATAHSDHSDHSDHGIEMKMDSIQGNVTKLQESVSTLVSTTHTDDLEKSMDKLMAAFKGATTVVETFATQRPPAGNGNPCANKKPATGFDNLACTEATVNEQAAADVSSPFTGTKDTGGRVPITKLGGLESPLVLDVQHA